MMVLRQTVESAERSGGPGRPGEASSARRSGLPLDGHDARCRAGRALVERAEQAQPRTSDAGRQTERIDLHVHATGAVVRLIRHGVNVTTACSWRMARIVRRDHLLHRHRAVDEPQAAHRRVAGLPQVRRRSRRRSRRPPTGRPSHPARAATSGSSAIVGTASSAAAKPRSGSSMTAACAAAVARAKAPTSPDRRPAARRRRSCRAGQRRDRRRPSAGPTSMPRASSRSGSLLRKPVMSSTSPFDSPSTWLNCGYSRIVTSSSVSPPASSSASSACHDEPNRPGVPIVIPARPAGSAGDVRRRPR